MKATKQTDWDQYYSRPYKASSLTRRHSSHLLLDSIRRYRPDKPLDRLVVAELGGANSCFYEDVINSISPAEYHILDTNKIGLDLLRTRELPGPRTIYHQEDVLTSDLELRADIVFSVGLIEHFRPEKTLKAIEAHFKLASPGGLVYITFPTPTWMYRAAQRLSEALGMWIFHDERPLLMEEVVQGVGNQGTILASGINWPIVYTQGWLAIRAHDPQTSRGRL